MPDTKSGMIGKKGKTLALELVDDLLEGVTGQTVKKNKETSTQTSGEDQYPFQGRSLPSKNLTTDPVIEVDLNEEPSKTHVLGRESASTKNQFEIGKSPTQPTTPQTLSERTSVGRFAPQLGGAAGPGEGGGSLAQSEYLRIAQNKILELESEVEKLRTQNEDLAAAGETLRRRVEETFAENQRLQSKASSIADRLESERAVLQSSQEGKEKELSELRMKVEELEMRLSSSIKKIRVRERELENRLELVKLESAAVVRSKDELILNLKRQLDQFEVDMDHLKSKGQDLTKQVQHKQELLRRTVKALRLALAMLEGEDSNGGNSGEQAG